jgi:galactokinase
MRIDHVPAGLPDDIAERLAARFAADHGRPATGIFAAPGRVNLVGEHVDYNGGRCLPLALPHATYVAVAPRTDDRVSLRSLQQPDPWHGTLAGLGPGRAEGWAAYAAGVGWALQQDGIEVPGFDLLVDSRVPLGAGLSSSAALECAVALALCSLAQLPVTDGVRRKLVRACMRAEAEVAGAPTGGMDQTVSLLAREHHALLLDCADGSTRHVPWQPQAAGVDLLVVDTRASHALSDGGYATRRADCEKAAATLGVASLRDLHDRPRNEAADGVETVLQGVRDPRIRSRARHVLTEMGRVDAAVEALRDDDLPTFGRLLDASHDSLRDDYEVSCPELDTVVHTAREHGALGSRMTGGGFGGSAIALVPRDAADRVAGAVTVAFADQGWAAPGVLAAPASAGARQVR